MKKVTIQIVEGGASSDFFIEMKGNCIIIETATENAFLFLWHFAERMLTLDKATNLSVCSGIYADFQVIMQIDTGYEGIINAMHILSCFDASEVIFFPDLFE